MVRQSALTSDFKAFTLIDDSICRLAWGKTSEKTKDAETGEETDSPYCVHTLERYPYRPNEDIVYNDIVRSGYPASMDEAREIAEGLGFEAAGFLRRLLLHYIEEYDSSTEVNSFLIGGSTDTTSSDDGGTVASLTAGEGGAVAAWIDRETRVSVTDSATKEKQYGRTETTLWLGGKEYVLPIDTVLSLLTQLEVYAKDCYNVTARHKAEVAALESVEDIMAYDYKSGYPEKLSISLGSIEEASEE